MTTSLNGVPVVNGWGACWFLATGFHCISHTTQSLEESSSEVLLAHAVTFVTELGHRRAQVTSAYALRVFQNLGSGNHRIFLCGASETCARVSVYRRLPNASSVYEGGHRHEVGAFVSCVFQISYATTHWLGLQIA